MKNFFKTVWLIAFAAVIGSLMVACDSGGGGGGGGSYSSGGTFTITGIPSQYNGMYAGIYVELADGSYLLGAQSYDNRTEEAIPVKIQNGSVTLPMYVIYDADKPAMRYSGNDIAYGVELVFLAAVDDEEPIYSVPLGNITFSNGSATKTLGSSGQPSSSGGQPSSSSSGGGSVSSNLVGVWNSDYYSLWFEFKSDGRLISSDEDYYDMTYTTTGNVITITEHYFGETYTYTLTYSISGNKLTLTANDYESDFFEGTYTRSSGVSSSSGGRSSSSGGIISPPSTGGTFTVSGIPSQYNGKYATIFKVDDDKVIFGFQSYTGGIMTLAKISNGSVSLPTWILDDDIYLTYGEFIKYSGNDTFEDIYIGIYENATVSDDDEEVNPIYADYWEGLTTFVNGSVAKNWSNLYRVKLGLDTYPPYPTQFNKKVAGKKALLNKIKLPNLIKKR